MADKKQYLLSPLFSGSHGGDKGVHEPVGGPTVPPSPPDPLSYLKEKQGGGKSHKDKD